MTDEQAQALLLSLRRDLRQTLLSLGEARAAGNLGRADQLRREAVRLTENITQLRHKTESTRFPVEGK